MARTQEAQADSIDSQDPKSSRSTKVKSRRPANTAFRQQRLKAWQPILTPKTVLPLFFTLGIIFAPIGGLLLWASSQVQEIVLDYSECSTRAPEGDGLNAFATMPGDKVSTSFKKSNNTNQEPPRWKRNTTDVEYAPGVRVSTNVCSLLFHIPNDIGPPVLMFYRLTNFYQNHRRYVKSLDQEQLRGTAKSNASIDDSCTPLRHNSSGFAYYPCGLIANSLFNDTIMTPQLVNVGNGNEANRTYEMTDRGIAWGSDRSLYGPTAYSWDQVAPPPNWERRYPGGYTPDNKPPNLQEDEAFQVWMRTAGLPTFSKLARRNDGEVMTRGTYRVDIRDNFPVTVYGGTKSLVISTRTVMGGKNPFLGIAYIVVGGICVLLGALFTAIHLVKPRKLGDHTYLSWNNDAPTTAVTATGRDIRPDNSIIVRGTFAYSRLARRLAPPFEVELKSIKHGVTGLGGDAASNETGKTQRYQRRQKHPSEESHSKMHTFYFMIVVLTTVVQSALAYRPFQCTTPPPSTDFLAMVSQLQQEQGNSTAGGSPAARASEAVKRGQRSLLIDTYFHVVSSTPKRGLVTQQQMNDQHAALKKAYEPYGISFALREVNFVVDDAWARGLNELSMKRSLRRGSYTSLNIYFHTDLPGDSLGKCTMPGKVAPNSDPFFSDGCNVAAGTVPNGSVFGYNQGKTAVHETGHWFGLLHTFEGFSCQGPGDFISDTPQQSKSTDGCPIHPPKNSCPDQDGFDAIRNYMDYSYDSCYDNFTPLQSIRMFQVWDNYRAGN